MKRENLSMAIQEAERFLKRAQDLMDASENEKYRYETLYSNPIEQGAVRRSSMDLTRALSRLRNK